MVHQEHSGHATLTFGHEDARVIVKRSQALRRWDFCVKAGADVTDVLTLLVRARLTKDLVS
jgi:hypothetical protein